MSQEAWVERGGGEMGKGREQILGTSMNKMTWHALWFKPAQNLK
jgi:hypothetical protein